MRIQSSFINFKANYYNLLRKNNSVSVNQISTDNAENLGNKPVLISGNMQVPMLKKGDFYTAKIDADVDKYRIYYKDTDKFENKGEEVKLDKAKLERLVNKSINGGSYSLVKGEATGRLLVFEDAKEFYQKFNEVDELKKEPLILMFKKEEFFNKMLPANVRGIIFTNGNLGDLSHIASVYRTYFDMVSIDYDENSINNLLKKQGEFLRLSNKNNRLQQLKIKTYRPNKLDEVKIPILDDTDKLLNYEECSKTNCGNKAYRISILDKLSKNGFLEEVTVPQGVVLPKKYLERIQTLSVDEMLDESEFKTDILSKFRDQNYLLVRSAFNGEDIDNYSTAGLYESVVSTRDEILLCIDDVCNSKNSERAKISRKLHNISASTIQPSVIIQEHIDADYGFTVYTKDKNKNLLIEISEIKCGERRNPVTVAYNSKTDAFSIIKKSFEMGEFLISDDYKVLSKKLLETDFVKEFDNFLPTLKKLVKNSLKLEEFFGRPQDIEGGLKDGKLYLWQVRNILKRSW